MPGRSVVKGTLNVPSIVRIIDSGDGTPETGVVAATAGLAFQYMREASALVSITALNNLAALTTAHTDGGILHIRDGYYRIDFQDAAFATGADFVLLSGTATGMIVIGVEHPLTNFDVNDGVRGGLTALPNAAADAALGLPISDAGGLDLDAKLANTNEITVARMGALTDWIDGNRLDLILDIIAADTTTDIPALIATAQADLDILTDADGVILGAAAVNLIWDELLAGHVIADSAGLLLNDWQDGGRLDLILDATALEATVAALNDISTGNVLTQVNAALDTVIAELGVAAPADTPSLRNAVMLLYMALLNRTDVQTSATDALEIRNAAGTIIAKKLLTDDGSDYSEAKMTSG